MVEDAVRAADDGQSTLGKEKTLISFPVRGRRRSLLLVEDLDECRS